LGIEVEIEVEVEVEVEKLSTFQNIDSDLYRNWFQKAFKSLKSTI